MTPQQAEQRVTEVGGDPKVLWEWLAGQTCGLYEDGTHNIYDWDVERFIRYKCDPKNEPIAEVD